MAFQPSMIAILGGGGNPIEGTAIKSTGETANKVLTADGSNGSSWAFVQGANIKSAGPITTNFTLYADGAAAAAWGASPKSLMTTKGDLLSFSTVMARLGVGSNGQMLQADSTQTTGLKWATVSGTGNITDINGDATAAQTLTVGTTGTDFAIVNNGTGDHAFNLPSASATARGVVTTGAQTFAGAKNFTGTMAAVAVNLTGLLTVTMSSGPMANFVDGGTFSTNADPHVAFSDGSGVGGRVGYFASNSSNFYIRNELAASVLIQTNSTTALTIASGGVITGAGTTDSTASTNGALILAGGLGVAKSIYQAASQSLVCGLYHVEASQQDSGNSGTAKTVDLSLGSSIKSTLTGSVTYTLTNPTVGGTFVFEIFTGAGSFTTTWPAAVIWSADQGAYVTTTTASKCDLVSLFWNGTNYRGSYLKGWAA